MFQRIFLGEDNRVFMVLIQISSHQCIGRYNRLSMLQTHHKTFQVKYYKEGMLNVVKLTISNMNQFSFQDHIKIYHFRVIMQQRRVIAVRLQ